MDKLKTLNDIHMEEYMRLIIKEVGIKWHKHLQETREDNVFDFLETFFNITEQDLK